MDRKRFVWSVAAALSVVSSSCEIAEAADPGFYIGAAGGRSEQRLDKGAGVGPIAVATFTPGLGTPTFPGLPVYGVVAFVSAMPELEADETDVGWDFALGYRVNKYFAAELTYMDSGEATLVERYPALRAGVPVSIPVSGMERSYTVSTRGPKLSLLGSLPLGSEWEVFVRGGVLFAKQEVTSRIRIDNPAVAIGTTIDADFSDEVVSVGAGVQWNFLPRWTARLEYQRTGDLQSNQVMGESRLDQASLSVLFGL